MGGPAALSEPVFGRGAAADEHTVIHGLYWLTLNMAEQRPIAILIDDVPWPTIYRCAFWPISPRNSTTLTSHSS